MLLTVSKQKKKKKKYRNNSAKLLYLGTFGMKYAKAIVTFEIINPEFLKLQSFVQRERTLNLERKTPYLIFF